MAQLLTKWLPEEREFWQQEGKPIAERNLWISIPCLFLAFAIWMIWSVLVVYLPSAGFTFTTGELFWLIAAPSLSGATLRIFYSFMISIFGGRRWTAISTGLLLIPAIGIGFAVQDTHTPYWVFLALAISCGFGGANFSSSMANISLFFPKSEKGSALGLNAGIGNLGVSGVQFVVPFVIAFALFGSLGGAPQEFIKEGVHKALWLQNAGFIWAIPVAICAVLAWLFMHDIASAKASIAEQLVIFKRLHTWLLCILYLGVFGSFIGFSAAFAMLTKTQFPAMNPTTYAFLGPLVGSLWRVAGGWMADKLSGSKVLVFSFAATIVGVAGGLYYLPVHGHGGSFWGFFTMFMVLFTATGIGNGACSQIMPLVFLKDRQNAAKGKGDKAIQDAVVEGNKEGSVVLGFTGAIGAYGGFFIPQAFNLSLAVKGSIAPAFFAFIIYYALCISITWFFYMRRSSSTAC